MAFPNPGRRDRSQLGAAVKRDRDVLFHDGAATSPSKHHHNQRGRRKGGTGASSSTASEAQSIQQSLLNTQNLLKNELSRVSQVATAIDEDGKLLEDTKKHQQSLNVSGAKSALTSLQRAQQHEQRVLMASVIFFFSVVFYIMWCRILVKLPFVERLVGLVFGTIEDLFQKGLSSLGPFGSTILESIKDVMQIAQDSTKQGLEVATELSKVAWEKAIEFSKEPLEAVKEIFNK